MTQLVVPVVCWLLAAVFLVALHHKVSAAPRFRAALAAYKLVPPAWLRPVAWGLTVLEMVALVLLLLVRPEGLIIAAGLLLVYGAAMAVNLLRGRRLIDCGCGDEPTPLSGALLGRNGVLIGLALAALPAAFAPAYSLDVLAAAFGLCLPAITLYFAVDQLLANEGRYRRLWLGVR